MSSTRNRPPHDSAPRRRLRWLGGLVLALLPIPGALAQALTISSPDARIAVTFRMPVDGTTAPPRWDATFRGRPLLAGCGLGLETVDGGQLLAGTRVVGEARRSVDEIVAVSFRRAAVATNRFNEGRWTLENPRKDRVVVVFRCHDDAIALRYELPADGRTDPVVVVDESTSFDVAGNPTAWVQHLEGYRTSHEHEVDSIRWDALRTDRLIDLPLTLSWPDDTTVAITEAALRRYAGMALMRPGDGGDGAALVSRLTPRADGTKVVRSLPMETPWRVALVADRPGALLESQTLHVLNEPSVIGDTGWIRPGKISFHWWNGDVFDGRPGEPILSFAMARRYIDFCASNGITAHSLTSTEGTTTPWYRQSKPGVEPGPDTDVTRPRADFDLPTIRRYAESKGVRLWSWVHQAALRGRVEEAFAAFERLGWSGLMVDFFDHDDQDTVEFAESILEAAARHRILIHLHGVWKPTGLERTYPNLMNHEGALNLEYLKWSARCTPEHNLRMAFTRLVAGPMDYHLGGFRAVPAAAFTPRHVAPVVLGTRGHMLAMYVCFDNPMPMVADHPAAYVDQPGFDFLRRVPTWWDDTRVLVGRIGELLVTMRRKGTAWYLGGMAARATPGVLVPLDFLPAGRYRLTLWKDGDDAMTDPNQLSIETREVASGETLRITIASGGGFAAELVPVR